MHNIYWNYLNSNVSACISLLSAFCSSKVRIYQLRWMKIVFNGKWWVLITQQKEGVRTPGIEEN